MNPLRSSRPGPHRPSRAPGVRPFWAALAAAGLLILAGLGWLAWRRGGSGVPAPAPTVAPARRSQPDSGRILVRLPADDAPHRNFMEWWYYNGHARTAQGRTFSFHYVYFLVNSVVPYTVAQVSVVDHQTGRRYARQRKSPGNPSAGAREGFSFDLGGWRMAGSDGRDVLRVEDPEFAFDLKLVNPGPTVYQGGTGRLDFGEAGSSFYYSRPRMRLEGSMTLDGATHPVDGWSWFDHQWGDFQPLSLGWDWFSLQLEDGADVMLYLLRDRQGRPVLASGTYTRDGATRVLGERDFRAEPTGTWKSRGTGVTYPTAWKIAIPALGIAVDVEPVVPDCEFDARETSLLLYWEGAVRVRGSHPGRGFQELCPPRAEAPR